MKKSVSIVIPVYNSERYLTVTVVQILDVLENLNSWNSEIVLVNDGSKDNSSATCLQLAKASKRITYVELSKNFGQQAATMAGISRAKGDLIITMDDDGQHPAEAIPQLLAGLVSTVDVIYAVAHSEEHGFFRSFLSRTAKNMLKYFLGLRSASEMSAFRIFRRNLLEAYLAGQKFPVAIDVALHWSTDRVKDISVPMKKRTHGKSNYSLSKLLRSYLNIVMSYSIRPLRIASFCGLIGFLLSFIFSIIILSQYLFGNIYVPGYTSTTLLISFLGSLQLLTLGIVGEYLGSLHLRTIGKPFFRITESNK
jgi:undecaprenyl-phosphate 4-deoxy-4-formamido-L-arabinose transferase